ncbi:MAG: DUF4965 domain-containing protein [Clostridia bacterium]|nr:DUF4965 domain-containing protein [Clostridia bacterium]
MRKIPCVPIITVDPYFSLWSNDEALNVTETMHWTGAEKDFNCYLYIDGVKYSILGCDRNARKPISIKTKVGALTTTAIHRTSSVEITTTYMTPLFPDDIKLMSRPVSYMGISYKSLDEKPHDVKLEIRVREEVCLNKRWQWPVEASIEKIRNIPTVRIGSKEQKVLYRSGDDIRQDWGYFYLSVADKNAKVEIIPGYRNHTILSATANLIENKEELVLFSYDDIYSIQYFGENLKSAWNNDGTTIKQAISSAAKEYKKLKLRAKRFDKDLNNKAKESGGEAYARLINHSFRQVIAAHKVAIDNDGKVLFISKECFSNGCAATVDVSYPSIPLFLIYNPELIKGMLRPIYKFNADERWKFDFAPHDCGQFPLVNGQVYGLNSKTGELYLESQMPVEECGNCIIMETNIALKTNDVSFAKEHLDTLKTWCNYLIKYGADPENQLCTDDFAGHFAHNCNLSLKAIMGIEGMSIIMKMIGDEDSSNNYHKIAKEMADSWCVRAKNQDGTTKLAFDQEGSFSLKYNMVWDKIWKTGLFPKELFETEVDCYISKLNKYGVPLDNRADYTKSDWTVWAATLTDDLNKFKKLIEPMDLFYRTSPSRVPMTDWYDTISNYEVSFQNRTVQGGLYIKML